MTLPAGSHLTFNLCTPSPTPLLNGVLSASIPLRSLSLPEKTAFLTASVCIKIEEHAI